MHELWDDYLNSEIAKLAGGAKIIVRRKINCFGAGESQIESMLPDMIRRGRMPTVGITASNASISLRIAAEGATEEECLRLIEPTEKTIRDCLGDLVFGEGDEDLQQVVVRLLTDKQQTLAVVEWGTGGLVSQWLSDVHGSENCFLGGIVAPNRMAFERHFTFDPSAICQTPQQNEAFLTGMVGSMRSHLKADWLLMIGSIPEDVQKDPLPIYLAVGNAETVKIKTIPFGFQASLRKIYVAKQALNLTRLTMLGK
jgi:nicotinamide-nucleotide amidase